MDYFLIAPLMFVLGFFYLFMKIKFNSEDYGFARKDLEAIKSRYHLDFLRINERIEALENQVSDMKKNHHNLRHRIADVKHELLVTGRLVMPKGKK